MVEPPCHHLADVPLCRVCRRGGLRRHRRSLRARRDHDAWITGAIVGADAVADLYRHSNKVHPDGTLLTRHLTTNVIVDIDEEQDARRIPFVVRRVPGHPDGPAPADREPGATATSSLESTVSGGSPSREMAVEQIGDVSDHLLIDLGLDAACSLAGHRAVDDPDEGVRVLSTGDPDLAGEEERRDPGHVAIGGPTQLGPDLPAPFVARQERLDLEGSSPTASASLHQRRGPRRCDLRPCTPP